VRLIDKEVDILGIVNINGFLRREIFTKLTLCLFLSYHLILIITVSAITIKAVNAITKKRIDRRQVITRSLMI